MLLPQQPQLVLRRRDENTTRLRIAHERTQLPRLHSEVLNEAATHRVIALHMPTHKVAHLRVLVCSPRQSAAPRLEVAGHLVRRVAVEVRNEAQLQQLLARQVADELCPLGRGEVVV